MCVCAWNKELAHMGGGAVEENGTHRYPRYDSRDEARAHAKNKVRTRNAQNGQWLATQVHAPSPPQPRDRSHTAMHVHGETETVMKCSSNRRGFGGAGRGGGTTDTLTTV